VVEGLPEEANGTMETPEKRQFTWNSAAMALFVDSLWSNTIMENHREFLFFAQNIINHCRVMSSFSANISSCALSLGAVMAISLCECLFGTLE